jgi:hypothetical protein
MKNQTYSTFAVAAVAALTLACSQGAAPPTSPGTTDPGSFPAGPDGSTLKVTAPVAVSPVGGVIITDTSPDLVISNATARFTEGLQLSYVFQVIDEDGRVVYTSPAVPAGGNGRTEHEVNMNLRLNEDHTWRAWAVYQGARGPMSSTARFRTFNRFGVSCAGAGSEIAIVACRKAQYGFIEHHERQDFVAKVAYDLNVGGYEHAPYGRLVKNEGNNCQGYSCDIICSDAGGFQRQWDILIDEDVLQDPAWNRVPEISVRPCEYVLQ